MTARLYAAAPWFVGRTHANPKYNFSSVGGRYVLIVFLPGDAAAREAAVARIQDNADLFHDERLVCFFVVRDEDRFAAAREQRGIRWFADIDGAISRLYGTLATDGREFPAWVLIDPSMRVLAIDPIAATDRAIDRMKMLPPLEQHSNAIAHAPVLITPRIFEPELCRHLITLYDQQGGIPSGTMREVDGKTIGVMSDFKRRSDVYVEDETLKAGLRSRLAERLAPEITKAFQFTPTRLERYLVACYNSEEGGYFKAHRDNTTAGTAHRRFAVSINLNADEYDGGDLRFPEFGARTYRPPTGGAVVFSCSLLHEATAVTRGRRYAFLPFLFDEAGEKIRQTNLHLVDGGPALDLRSDRSN